jgi:hypothetical protein
VLVADSITKLGEEADGRILVAGSHAGLYPGHLAAAARLRGVILNDAGGGLDEAGIAALAFLDKLWMPTATVGHFTARIGNGADMIARGVISRINSAAAALGCRVGETCYTCAVRMAVAAPSLALAGVPPPYEEARTLLRQGASGEPSVWGLDSASLVRPEDAGQIIVTGSHGGLLGGRPETALRVDALAAVFNDAGIGIDRAGISRLRALNERGIAAVTVAAASARIGDARSTWKIGRISAANDAALRVGAYSGMSIPTFADLVIGYRQHRQGTPWR